MQSKRCPFETETEVKKWHFRLMNNSEQFEKEVFIDRMNEINFAIKQFRKQMNHDINSFVKNEAKEKER
jgi:hypothetical protein